MFAELRELLRISCSRNPFRDLFTVRPAAPELPLQKPDPPVW